MLVNNSTSGVAALPKLKPMKLPDEITQEIAAAQAATQKGLALRDQASRDNLNTGIAAVIRKNGQLAALVMKDGTTQSWSVSNSSVEKAQMGLNTKNPADLKKFISQLVASEGKGVTVQNYMDQVNGPTLRDFNAGGLYTKADIAAGWKPLPEVQYVPEVTPPINPAREMYNQAHRN